MDYNQAIKFAEDHDMEVDWYHRGHDSTYYVQATLDGYMMFEEDLDPKNAQSMQSAYIKAITECAAFHGLI